VLADADAAAIAMREYFTGLCADRRARPRDDLVSALVQVSDADSARLNRDELLANLMLLLVAGFETTTNLLGNGLRIVLGEPSLRSGLSGGSVPAGQFVAEALRYDSPVQLTSRRATVTAEVGEVTTAPGAEVITLLGAANRDPRRFGAPNEFRPARRAGQPADQLRRGRPFLPRRRPGPARGGRRVPPAAGPVSPDGPGG